MNREDEEPSGGTDWFDQQPPPPAADDFADGLTALYAKYGRGAPSAEELASHRGNPGGLQAVEALLQKDNAAANPTPTPMPEVPSGANRYQALASGVSDPAQGFGAPPPPYQSSAAAPTYEAPAKPGVLQAPYVAPTWQGGEFKTPDKPLSLQTEFKAPTMEELTSSAGYLSRLAAQNRTLERGAAGRGTILNGGTQRALGEAAQDYAANEYGNLFNQRVTTRGIADTEYGADVANAANQFGTNFGVFQTGVSNGLNARRQNADEYQSDVNNAQTSFSNRYGSYLNENARTLSDYLTNYNIGHTAETDYWGRLRDLSGGGLDAAKNGRPA